MKLVDVAKQMRELGVKHATLSRDGDVLTCELFAAVPSAPAADRPETEDERKYRERREAEEAEKLLFMASEGNPDLPFRSTQ